MSVDTVLHLVVYLAVTCSVLTLVGQAILAFLRWREAARTKAVTASRSREPEPEPVPPTPEQVTEYLRRIHAQRVAGWDLHWEPSGGCSGSFMGKDYMHRKLELERRMHTEFSEETTSV